jgi:hypothetical protein
MPVAPLFAVLAALCAQGPFDGGPRWRDAAPPSAPWLPGALGFTAGGEALFDVAQGTNARAALHSSAPARGGAALAPLASLALPGLSGTVDAAVGDELDELYVLVQRNVRSGGLRATELARLALSPQGGLSESWRVPIGGPGNGAARVVASRDGGRVAVALGDSAAGSLLVEWRAGPDGALLATRSATAGPLRAFAASADLDCVAVVAGSELRVLRGDGTLEHAETLPGSTNALALAAEARVLAVGALGQVRVLAGGSAGWALSSSIAGVGAELPVRAALDDDGSTLALGWWDSASGRGTRAQVWDLGAGALRYARATQSAPSAPQDYLEALALTRDGARAAFGRWGGDGQPEAWLVDVASGQVLLSADVSGSVRALSLDEHGSRLALSAKSTHASVFGSTGEVVLFDTGERLLQCVEEARAGGSLALARLAPQAASVLFFVGPARGTPAMQGGLPWWVDRASASILPRTVASDGVARLSLSLSPAAAGTVLTVQSVERVPGVGTRVQPEVLRLSIL